MKLKDDFYHIVAMEQGEEQCRCKVRMNPRHFIYKVHFPNFPVTPGVCMVQMASEILAEFFKRQFVLDTAVNIKFRERMGPEEEATFVFSKIVFDDDRLSVSVSVENDKAQYVKMSMRYQVR